VLSVAVIALAPVANAQTGDSVTGGAVFIDPGHLPPGSPPALTLEFHFDANSGPSGENPTGTATWSATTPFGTAGGGGSVTCLDVEGTQATIGTLSSPHEVTYFFVSGLIGFATVPVTATSPTYCPSGPGLLDASSISQYFEPRAMSSYGVIIHDAQPLPTTKDQCKNGGWRNFPGFKNEGDCVSFVATSGKTPPVD
jgi:hypothetical protein